MHIMLLIHRHANSCKNGLKLCIAVQCIQKGFLLRDFSVSHALVLEPGKRKTHSAQSYLLYIKRRDFSTINNIIQPFFRRVSYIPVTQLLITYILYFVM